ncbi:MAG: FRG domain-containing protein [Candidatus Cloacimonetes bacterium]|nr:FRG domain-containing protein [Candidatus Cloacimonadota bacterium]
MTNEIIATGWNHLQDLVFADSWNENLGRFRSRKAFRGLSHSSYRLETTLTRLGGEYSQLERHLLRNFRKYASGTVVEGDTFWHWLAVAQHHGLSTRLLDWTYSPFVAMHFATANIAHFDEDGAIWAVDYVKVQQYLPQRLYSLLCEEGANVFTVHILKDQIATLYDLNNITESDIVLFLEPPSIDDNFINQFAFFSISNNPRLVLDEWLQSHPDIWQKIIIPRKLKWEIRDKLDQANITERVLFPGLDGLSAWLKRQYSPKS